jgi:hypothetical protein
MPETFNFVPITPTVEAATAYTKLGKSIVSRSGLLGSGDDHAAVGT